MRTYLTTTVETAERIFRDGFADLYEEFGRGGVYVSSRPLDANDGFEGDVVLCLEAPENVVERHDVSDASMSYRLALVPAAELNKLGKPRVYDHAYAGASRKELLDTARRCEQDEGEASQSAARARRNAIEFFDAIGWLTPLRLQEEEAR